MGVSLNQLKALYDEKMEEIARITLAYRDKYGDEALEVAKKIMFERGLNIGKRLADEISGDLRKFLPALTSHFAGGPLFEIEKQIVAEKKLIKYHETKCPVADLYKRLNLPVDMLCDVFHEIDKGIAAGANLKMSCDQGLSRGKGYCDWTWEIP